MANATIDVKKLKRLQPALDGRKDRDAAVLAARREAVCAVDAKRAALEAARDAVVAETDPTDIAAQAVLAQYQAAVRRRLSALAEERASLQSAALEAQQTLTRSNGEAEALRTLVKAPR